MKIPVAIICSALLCSLFTGCGKNHNNREQNMMRFSLNGNLVACDNKFFSSPQTTAGPDANITFYARWGDNEIDFQLFTYTTSIAPGKYEFGPHKAFAASIWPDGTSLLPGIHHEYFAGSIVQSDSIAGSGQITISEINADHIKGSFDFTTGINTLTGLVMNVTNGVFYINR